MTSPADTIREALQATISTVPGWTGSDPWYLERVEAALAALTELEAEVTRWQDGYDVAAMRANRAEAKVDEALRVTAAAAEVDTARAVAAEADRDRLQTEVDAANEKLRALGVAIVDAALDRQEQT
jgi:hypothetical protein